MKDLIEAFKKAQEVQEEAGKLQEELKQREFEGKDTEGLIKVVLNGSQEPLSVQISNDALSLGVEAVSALVYEAMKDAYKKSTIDAREQMEKLVDRLQIRSFNC